MKTEVEAATISETTVPATATVQHVTKSSSDQLLSKFADDSGNEGSAEKKLRPRLVVMVKDHRQRYNKYDVTAGGGGDHHSTSFSSHCDDSPSSYASNWSSLVERKALLPCAKNHHHHHHRRSSSSTLLRQLGIGNGKSSRHHHHLRTGIISFRNKSLFVSIHKTWRKTVQGASKVLVMEKRQQPLHYNTSNNNRHKRLICDAAAIY